MTPRRAPLRCLEKGARRYKRSSRSPPTAHKSAQTQKAEKKERKKKRQCYHLRRGTNMTRAALLPTPLPKDRLSLWRWSRALMSLINWKWHFHETDARQCCYTQSGMRSSRATWNNLRLVIRPVRSSAAVLQLSQADSGFLALLAFSDKYTSLL